MTPARAVALGALFAVLGLVLFLATYRTTGQTPVVADDCCSAPTVAVPAPALVEVGQ